MRIRTAALILSCALWTPLCSPLGAAGSLWTSESRALITDHTASRVGDIVTIIVVERSTTAHQAAHQAGKTLDASAGPGGGILGFFPDLSVKSSRSTAGTGAATQSTRLVDRVSGIVTAVTPQGNLQIAAVRHLKLNRDDLALTITGTVRSQDISPDNTVLSTQVAGCRMEWSGRGPIPEKQSPGLLSALLSLLW